MDAIMLLCDRAEAINGKLYTMGAGWSVITAFLPINCSVAIRIEVPWSETNTQHKLTVELIDEDGTSVVTDPVGNVAKIEGLFEVGRPAGLPHGTAITNCFAFHFQGLDLQDGGYAFVLSIDEEEKARCAFLVRRISPPEGAVSQ